jgi:uncharacterized membrane protein HdeD (DUF308 family)
LSAEKIEEHREKFVKLARLEIEAGKMGFSIEGRLGKFAVLAGIMSFVVGVFSFNIFAPLIFEVCVCVGIFLVISGFLAIVDIFSARRKSVAALSALFIFASGACFASALVLPILDVRVQMTYAFWCFDFHTGQFLYAFPLSPFFFPLIALSVILSIIGIVVLTLFKQ